MEMKDIHKIKLMNEDVLVMLDENEAAFRQGRIIQLKNRNEARLDYCKVLKVSDKVTDVKVGDTVLLSWTNMTPPFLIGTKRVAVTSQERIEGILENDT